MRISRRDFLHAWSVLGAASVLGACAPAGSGSEGTSPASENVSRPTEPPATSAPSKQVEIIWLGRISTSENPWEQEVAIPSFEEANPNVKVNLILVEQADMAVKVKAMMAAARPMHIFNPHADSGVDCVRNLYLTRPVIENLTPLVEKDNYDYSDFIPYCWELYKYAGKQYGMPQLTIGSYVYWNKDLFEEKGMDPLPTDWSDTSWTWDKFLEIAKELTHDYDEVQTALYGASVMLTGAEFFLDALPWGLNALPPETYDKDSKTVGLFEEAYFTDPTMVKAWQARHDLMWKHRVMPTAAISAALEQLGGMFPSGKLAMEQNGGWAHWSYYKLWEDPSGFRWGAAPIPYGDPAYKGPRGVVYTDPWCMTAGLPEDEKLAAWELLKHICSAEQQWSFAEMGGMTPPRVSLMDKYFSLFEGTMSVEEAKEGFLGIYDDNGFECAGHLIVGFDELKFGSANLAEKYWNSADYSVDDILSEVDQYVEEIGLKYKNEMLSGG